MADGTTERVLIWVCVYKLMSSAGKIEPTYDGPFDSKVEAREYLQLIRVLPGNAGAFVFVETISDALHRFIAYGFSAMEARFALTRLAVEDWSS